LSEPGPSKFDKPPVVLDFSQGHSIDIIKDSELTLNNISSSSTESYSFQKEKIIIKLPNNREIKQNVRLGIADAKNGNLVSFSSTGVIMPDEEAYEVAKILHQNLNLSLDSLESWYETEMPKYTTKIKEYSISANKTTYPRLGFAIRRGANKLYPSKIKVNLDWFYWRRDKEVNEAYAEANFASPPAEYSTISLEPPSGKIYDGRDWGKKSLEDWRKNNPEEAKEYDERQAKANQASQKRELKQLPETASPEENKLNFFPWRLLGIVGLIVIFGFMLLKGKSK